MEALTDETRMMESATHIPQMTLLAAFGAGFLSFVSPCVLPLVPSSVSYITGLSIDQLKDPSGRHLIRKTILGNALWFIGGFSVVFIAFGVSASVFGQWLINYQEYLRKTGGVLIILFRLYVLGCVQRGFFVTRKAPPLPEPPGWLSELLSHRDGFHSGLDSLCRTHSHDDFSLCQHHTKIC
jgi:cytochrome c-type biogenesis protein